MATLLHLDASARTRGSHSRALTALFVDTWRRQRADDRVISRDLAGDPPPPVTAEWIRAAFTGPGERTPAMRRALSVSDRLIGELGVADIIVMGAPMYNYGMPSTLKAWFDQVIRVDETFSFDLGRGDWPLEPIMTDKTLVLLTSCGEFGFAPGGARADMNHLDTHIRTCARYLGVDETHHIGIEYQEFGDDRHERSVAAARSAVVALARRLSA